MNERIVDGYMQLLNHLSAEEKLELISKLTVSTKSKKSQHKGDEFGKSFGAWHSKKTPEQIIKELRRSRSFKRKMEHL